MKKLKQEFGLNDKQVKHILEKFHKLGINPIALPNSSNQPPMLAINQLLYIPLSDAVVPPDVKYAFRTVFREICQSSLTVQSYILRLEAQLRRKAVKRWVPKDKWGDNWRELQAFKPNSCFSFFIAEVKCLLSLVLRRRYSIRSRIFLFLTVYKDMVEQYLHVLRKGCLLPHYHLEQFSQYGRKARDWKEANQHSYKQDVL